ncbi:hypothetical protein JZK55_16280 [Dissulfurispira thermophila]|uniref:DUF948 domain-containing protein n=1 Tax=Dissulfurispira thermophila TaxID=2715679 RepID=A0A7G1H458_9BACT|nr:DUF948 domain-containing protein [Dissulfurispira thermophila]BCB96706.1 hypothetical protein JZK55_16280 [Dissulfurispira thermophila]
MNSQSWIIILSVGFFIMAFGFIAAIVFLIYASLEIRRAAQAFREFLKNTEEKINPVMEETEQTLKSLKKVSDDVGTVTENARNFSSALYEIVNNIRAISNVVHDVREGVSLRVLGLRAGIKTALEVLIKNLRS